MKHAVASLFLLSLVTSIKAQYYFYNEKYYASAFVCEVSLHAGAMNSLTDLGGRKGAGKDFLKDLNLHATSTCYGLSFVTTWKEAIALHVQTTYGTLGSADALLKNSDPNLNGRYGRNLSFQTTIHEILLTAELHPLCFMRNKAAPFLSPYFIIGYGYFLFNPKAKLEGEWYALQPLRLEGQGFPEYPLRKIYRLHEWSIPAGIGIRYEVSASFYLRIELVHRFLFTDYLDDVSNTYVDPSLFSIHLIPTQAVIARKLYSRMQELQPGFRVNDQLPRGDNTDGDAYLSLCFKIGFTFRRRR